MFLEERVEQLENLAADQGRQIELVAGGLATLTVEVRGIRQDMTDGFARVDEQFARVNRQFDEMRQEFTQEFVQVRQEFAEGFVQVRQEFAEGLATVNHRLDEMSTTQQLILTILTEKLK